MLCYRVLSVRCDMCHVRTLLSTAHSDSTCCNVSLRSTETLDLQVPSSTGSVRTSSGGGDGSDGPSAFASRPAAVSRSANGAHTGTGSSAETETHEGLMEAAKGTCDPPTWCSIDCPEIAQRLPR